MLSRVYSSTLWGIDAVLVQIEVQLLGALRRFSIVGLPDGVVREAKERVRCAVENSGFPFPTGEVIVSLAPADLPKAGSSFDLAIAAAILAALGVLPAGLLERKILLGELALDGTVKPARGALASACLARELGFGLFTAAASAAEASLVEDVEICAVESLSMLAANRAEPFIPVQETSVPDGAGNGATEAIPSFSDVVGQFGAKRALEIAAAGRHNVLMIGPPGSGKSMLAERLKSILPDPSPREQIEVIKIHSADTSQVPGDLRGRAIQRPFRSPHHTVSTVGLIGGGSNPLPGEVSLAHHGVLFLDELPHVRREALDALREPLETQRVLISRARQRVCFPADFLLIAAMNPCPCGKKGMGPGSCSCAPGQVQRYIERISGPVRDRIDLQVWVPPVAFSELAAGVTTDPTAAMRDRVTAACERQSSRNKGKRRGNARLTPTEVRSYCKLDGETEKFLSESARTLDLSARGYNRILKVARTIADLGDCALIREEHLREALHYRMTPVFA